MARIPKHIIVIDDENQEAQQEYIEGILSRDYDIHVHLIKTSDDVVGEDGNISQEMLKEKLQNIMTGKTIDLVLTDFELADTIVSGIEVVKLVKSLRPGVPVIMYSGKKEEVVERLLGDYKNKDVDDLIKSINEYVSWGIVEFLQRDHYTDKAIQFVKKKKTVQVNDVFVQKLREIGDKKFEAGYPDWRDKTLNDICDIIENRSDARSDAWMDDLIEQVVVYISKTAEE